MQLSTVVQRAVELAGLDMAWLLALDGEQLVTRAIIHTQGENAVQRFRETLARYTDDERLPNQATDNPLAWVLVKNKPLHGVTTARLDQMPGGIPLVNGFEGLGIHYLSILPLHSDDQALGVLLLGAANEAALSSEMAPAWLEMLQQQAVLALYQSQQASQLATLQAAQAQHSRLPDLLLDALSDGAVLVNGQHRILACNQAFLAQTGLTAPDLIDQDVHVLFPDAHKAAALRAINQLEGTLPAQQVLWRADKSPLPANMTVRALGGEPGFILLTFQPVQAKATPMALPANQAQRLRALTRASQALNSAMSLHEVIEIILSSALEVVNGMSASILLINIDQPDELIVVSSVGPHAEAMQGRRVPVGSGVVGWVAAEARAQLVSNVVHDPRFQPGLDAHEALTVRSLAAIPLKTSEMVIGVLAVINKKEGLFDESDMEILESLSSSAAVAIQNANLFDQTQRRLTEMSTLLEASAAVTSTLELHDILDHITRRLINALDVGRVLIATREESGDTLSVLAEMVDATWMPANAPTLRLDDVPVKQLAVEQRVVTLASRSQPDLSTTERLELEVRGLGAVLNMPLRVARQVQGLVALYHEDPNFAFDTILQTAVSDAMDDWAQAADDPWTACGALCHRIMETTAISWVAVYRWDAETERLYLAREVGSAFAGDGTGQLWGLHRYPLMQHVVESGDTQLVWTEDIAGDLEEKTYLTHVGAGAALMVPLVIRGEPAGIVKLMAIERRLFDSGELSLCQGIANVVGNALENAALYMSLEQRARAVEAAYRDLEAADQLKDNLLQNLSHEISTPLMHILGYVSLLRDEEFGPLTPEQAETLDQVAHKSDHIAEIVRDMVAAYATRSGQMTPKRVKLQKVAALAVRSLTGKANAAQIKIVPRIQDNLPRVLVDQGLMGQVFEALIDNAIKFSHSGGQVEVAIRDPGGPMLEVCVRDQGIGIPPHEYEKIFMRFYQVHSGTTRRFEGTGLGLSIVHDVVESHGGRVWVESEVGQGTAIFFTVPKANLNRTSSLARDDQAAV